MDFNEVIDRIATLSGILNRDGRIRWDQEGLTLLGTVYHGTYAWRASINGAAYFAGGKTMEEAAENLLPILELEFDQEIEKVKNQLFYLEMLKRSSNE